MQQHQQQAPPPPPSDDLLVNHPICSPVLDMFGTCHCPNVSDPHVPVIVPMQGRSYPPCREPSFRALYLDDSILASIVRLDQDCVPLLPTAGPHSKFDGCGLGIPGQWFQLEHRLREIDRNVKSIGMVINPKKTTLMVFNPTKTRQCLPFCSLSDGDPLPLVCVSRLLGLIIDDRLSWWPLVRDLVRRAKAKIWSLAKCRDLGADTSQLLWNMVPRCIPHF